MLESLRSIRAIVAILIAAGGSAAMYYNHRSREVSEGDLCRQVERHVIELSSDANGVLQEDPTGLAYSILDRCEQHFSKSKAHCILRATSLSEVRACS